MNNANLVSFFPQLGDEMFSDTYPMTLVKDCLYEVTGKVNMIYLST